MLGVLFAVGCGSPDPFDLPPRFVVLPWEHDSAGAALTVGVAWIPVTHEGEVTVTDTLAVPGISEDFAWNPIGPAPEGTLRTCDAIDCLDDETAAVGWLVAFEDQDGDGAATLDLTPTSPADLSAQGDDRLVAIATDHVLAYAPADLDPEQGLARTLGWPLLEGATVVDVRVEDGEEHVSPVVTRERVPLYLLARSSDEQPELGLCCDVDACANPDVHCPTFPSE